MNERDEIEKTLDRILPAEASSELYQAARYSVFSGGKRIRPLLTLATVKMLGGDLPSALIPACALELVHTYSLIHDDLPCMDDDDFRRGKPTLHKVYTEGQAVLAGDFLLTYAFELLTTCSALSDGQKLLLISTLAKASGGEGMIGGQVLDIRNDEATDLKTLHEKKTGALFAAAVQFGGIVSGSSMKDIRLLEQLGYQIGYLFQVVDDFLDGEHQFTQADIERASHVVYQSLNNFGQDQTHIKELIDRIVLQVA